MYHTFTNVTTTDRSSRLFLGVYVDDILCLDTNPDTFNLNVDSFLGMKIEHDLNTKTISLYQQSLSQDFIFSQPLHHYFQISQCFRRRH